MCVVALPLTRRSPIHHRATTKHKQHPKDPSSKAVPPDTWGMLLTCQGGRDRRAVDEARALFEEAFARMGKSDILTGAGSAAAAGAADGAADGAAASGGGGGGGGGQSVEALLAAEVAQLKDAKRSNFRWHDTGVNNTVFVAFPKGPGAPSPSAVAENVLSHIKATKVLPARFLNKLLPVEATCFVGLDEIKKAAEAFLPGAFEAVAASVAAAAGGDKGGGDGGAAKPLTFAVDLERRSCGSLDHMAVVNAVAKAVPAPHTVNLRAPDATVVVQLVRNVCAIAVCPRYKALCKYNVRVAAEDEDGGENEGGGGGNGGGAAEAAAGGGGGGEAAKTAGEGEQQPAAAAAVGEKEQQQPEEAKAEPAAA